MANPEKKAKPETERTKFEKKVRREEGLISLTVWEKPSTKIESQYSERTTTILKNGKKRINFEPIRWDKYCILEAGRIAGQEGRKTVVKEFQGRMAIFVNPMKPREA